ncbi:hypothetical protein PG995_012335 [Apiospora arundinis]
MSSFNQEMPKSGGKSSGGRFAFLRTKRVLATLSLLVVVAIILIALGASGVFAGHHDNKPAETPKPTSAADRRQFPGSIANGTALRIMPLGASTVRGENSPATLAFASPCATPSWP